MIDDLLLQEIFSLREQLKIAVEALKRECPYLNETEFLHHLKAVDYEQLMEEIMNEKIELLFDQKEIEILKDALVVYIGLGQSEEKEKYCKELLDKLRKVV